MKESKIIHNLIEGENQYKPFGSLVVYHYKGTSPIIKQVERVATYLQTRKYRVALKEKQAQNKIKIDALLEKWANMENVLEAEKILTEVEKLENSKPKVEKVAIGSLQAIPKENAYWFKAFNGEKFRIPEPKLDLTLPEEEQGMPQIFDYEFKRVTD